MNPLLDQSTNETPEPLWAIIELMGHVKTGGRVSKDNQLGTGLIRCDVPIGEGFATQLINTSSVYRITFCEEKLARACAAQGEPMPFSKWELPRLTGPKDEPEDFTELSHGDAEEDL